jgi:ankyrin repeat protein
MSDNDEYKGYSPPASPRSSPRRGSTPPPPVASPHQSMAMYRTPSTWTRHNESMASIDNLYRNSPLYGPELLRQIYDYTVYDEKEHTLEGAARNGNLPLVKFLVTENQQNLLTDLDPNNVQRFVQEYERACMVASQYGQLEVVKYLVSLGMSQVRLDNAFVGASMYGYLDVVEVLLEAGANVHAFNDYAVRLASKNGHLDVVKYLVEEHGADVRAQSNNAIKRASENGHLDVVKYLVEECDVDVHASNDWAVRIASGNGHLDVVKYLVSMRANIHADDDYAVRWASEKGHLNVVKVLVDAGANIRAKNDNALEQASENGHLDVVKYLVSKGAKVGNTQALRLARFKNHWEVVRFLDSIKPKPSKRRSKGRSKGRSKSPRRS